jgi:hypothetical protein
VNGREESSTAGATADLEVTRAKRKLAETAREQRASRGVTAGREGKALKAESYGRMWRETEPRGPGGLKPLRE